MCKFLAFLFLWRISAPIYSQIEKEKTIFFLHNRFLEEHSLEDSHPEFGRVQYQEILAKFKSQGFKVISEKRGGNVNVQDYARKIVAQIDSLILLGHDSKNITVIGTSKGGYIAQYVSTYADNADLNFVFVACYREGDLQSFPDINFCGNILNIYENSDPYGVSALARKNTSTCNILHFKEVELYTKMGHGFLFKALDDWIDPALRWADGNYR